MFAIGNEFNTTCDDCGKSAVRIVLEFRHDSGVRTNASYDVHRGDECLMCKPNRARQEELHKYMVKIALLERDLNLLKPKPSHGLVERVDLISCAHNACEKIEQVRGVISLRAFGKTLALDLAPFSVDAHTLKTTKKLVLDVVNPAAEKRKSEYALELKEGRF